MKRPPFPVSAQGIDTEPSAERSASLPTTPPGRKELGGRLAGLTLPQQVLVLAIWPFMEQVLNLMVGTVDLALAGRLEPRAVTVAALDALGVAGFMGWLMGTVLGSVGVGSTALIARATGARHRSLANAALGQSLVLGVIVGAISGMVLYLAAPAIGRLISLRGLSLEYVVVYLRLVALAAPAQALLFIGNACLRGSGDTRTPFTVMIVVNVVNISTSWLFVFGPAPFGGQQVRGIAAGTVVAWCCGAAMILFTLLRGRAGIQLRTHRLRPHWHTIRRIVRVGVPNLLETVGGTWLATFAVLIIVGWFAVEGLVGAHMIAIRVESFSFQPGFALGIAAATLAGQYLGLGDPDRARRGVLLCWVYAAIAMSVMGVAFIVMPGWLARIITSDALMIARAAPLIRLCGTIQIFFATYMVLSFALRGAGDTRTTMKLTYLSVFLIRVPGAYLLGHVLGLGLIGVWIALCADITVKGLLFAGRFLHGGWQKVEV